MRSHRLEAGLSCAAILVGLIGWARWCRASVGFLASAPLFIARYAVAKDHPGLLPPFEVETARYFVRYVTRPLFHYVLYNGSCDRSESERDTRLRSEPAILEVETGVTLRGRAFKCNQPKGVLLVFAALGGTVNHYESLGRKIQKLGWDVKLLDIRGYGESDGFPSPEAHCADVRQIVESVNEYGQVAIYGHCGGGPQAAHAASLIGDRLRVLILDRFIRDIPTAGWTAFLGPLGWTAGHLVAWCYPGYDTAEACTGVDASKIWVIHGDRDRFCGREHNLAEIEPTVVSDCGHSKRWWKYRGLATSALESSLGA